MMQGRSYTREDIVKALDADIAWCTNRNGKDSPWTKVYMDKKTHVLARYDAGHKVLVEKEFYYIDNIEHEIQYYSDGSVKVVCYNE